MKDRQVSKPVLNTAEALAFATGSDKKENTGVSMPKEKKVPKNASKKNENSRIFFAPAGDTRLTINIDTELHKKLKIAAIENGSTAGDLIEQLIKKHL